MGGSNKTDEFLEKGGAIFNQKIYVADFVPLNRTFPKQFATWFSENEGGVKCRLELFQKIIRFGVAARPLCTNLPIMH